ncbi:uncharacterized protein H6S33_002806 [Morchella sextelata]|uniref:uncharacterized protein n=1 Tax=Morchella sextelata TaxID=1174677 RepID=UPI001D05A41A|nr:uncharacterized protein H6S33_002806 [Morchella sextelata]KAH0607772.1 hypothetical protein H6S33_002806 [Morchella sextelata]
MLYSFGSNSAGQLSLSHLSDTPTPTPCTTTAPLPRSAPTIVSGGNHTLLLFPTGAVFAAGDNTHAQCCHPPSTPQLTSFHPVPLPHITLASAGWNFTVLSTTAGDIYVSGQGPKGELGLGPVTSAALQRLPDFPPPGTRVVALASGMAHTLAVLDSGEVYGWGAGRKGQLGMPAVAVVDVPRKVGVGWEVEMAACGREFSVLLSRADEGGVRRVVVLGGDKYGLREGLGEEELVGVVGVQAGWGGLVVRFEGGKVRGWGRDDRGQLPPGGLEVEAVAVGSEHGVAVVAGEVVAWGWGEHGNCGGGGDVAGGAVRGVAVPGARGRVLGVGAGCATSWVWVEEEGVGNTTPPQRESTPQCPPPTAHWAATSTSTLQTTPTGPVLGGLVLTNGVTNANLYSMVEIILTFGSGSDYHLQNAGGSQVDRDDHPLLPGNYYVATDGSFSVNSEPWLARTLSVASGTLAAFRDAVRERDRRCVITGEEALDAEYGIWEGFEAAHIFPLAHEGHWRDHDYGRWITPSGGSINSVQNGGEPVFECDFPPGSDMMGEIREGPKAAERMEYELFSRLAGVS